jgi:hypothetical protein
MSSPAPASRMNPLVRTLPSTISSCRSPTYVSSRCHLGHKESHPSVAAHHDHTTTPSTPGPFVARIHGRHRRIQPWELLGSLSTHPGRCRLRPCYRQPLRSRPAVRRSVAPSPATRDPTPLYSHRGGHVAAAEEDPPDPVMRPTEEGG